MTQAVAKPEAAAAERVAYYKPYYNIDRGEDAYDVRVYMPGVAKNGVELTVDEDVLTVIGNRTDHAPEGWKTIRRELTQADYRLRLQLGHEVDESKITAAVADGVLTLVLPKAEAAKPRTISVE